METPQEVLVNYMYFMVETMHKVLKDPMSFGFLAPDDIDEIEKLDANEADELLCFSFLTSEEIKELENTEEAKELSCFNFLTQEDIEELESWDTSKAENVVEKLSKTLNFGFGDYAHDTYLEDAYLFPWCLYHYDRKPNCKLCEFGERHGYCGNTKSLYSKFRNKFGPITNILEKDPNFLKEGKLILK